jgi:hypothetical protein
VAQTTAPDLSHRVPVEHRFLGLDRRTLPLALVALGVWVLWAVVLPFIDARVDFTQQTQAGDVFQVNEDVTFTPSTGWGVLDGLRTTDVTLSGAVSDDDVVLVNGGVVLAVQPGPFTGTATDLLRQFDDVPTIGTNGAGDPQLVGDPSTLQADDGTAGVAQAYSTPVSTGLVVAFTERGQGILIEVVGPPEQLSEQAQDIAQMIASFDFGSAA